MEMPAACIDEQIQKFAKLMPRHFVSVSQEQCFQTWQVALQKHDLSQSGQQATTSTCGVRRHAVDGGGTVSRGDWRIPPPGSTDIFKHLRQELMSYGIARDMHKRLLANMEQKGKQCPFTQTEIEDIRYIMVETVCDKIREPDLNGRQNLKINEGQPFLLNLVEDMASLAQDHDTTVIQELRNGVRTGYGECIPTSGTWPRRPERPEQEEVPLLQCESNWLSAEEDAPLTQKLVQDEIDNQFVKVWPGTLDDAKRNWPLGVSVGKLGVQKPEGKDPRLTLDITVSGVSTGITIEEKPQYPQAADVARTFEALETPKADQDYVGFVMDVSKAHKRFVLKAEEQGLMMFQFLGVLYHYVVCHFGGAFSAYWCARFLALLHRLLHLVVYVDHGGFIYVDDWLWKFREKVALEFAMLLSMVLVGVGCPLSWHKFVLDREVIWIGVAFNFYSRMMSFPAEKLAKAANFLDKIAGPEKVVDKKELLSGTGLLMWMSMLMPLFRPWLAEFYQALCHSPLLLVHCSVHQLAEITTNLDENLCLVKNCCLTRAQRGWRLKEIAHKPITSLTDATAAVVGGLGRAWVHMEDPAAKDAVISKDLRTSARIWSKALTTSAVAIPFTDTVDDVASAAADAYANSTEAGLGGWFDIGEGTNPSEVAWFQCIVAPSDFPDVWKLRAIPQRDISFYELIAQAYLFHARMRFQRLANATVNLRQDCDNITSVCVGNKLFTTATPMRHAAQVLCAHALKCRASINLQHIPGKINDLADKLSRQHSPEEIGVSTAKRVHVSVQDLLDSLPRDL